MYVCMKGFHSLSIIIIIGTQIQLFIFIEKKYDETCVIKVERLDWTSPNHIATDSCYDIVIASGKYLIGIDMMKIQFHKI